MNSLLKNAPYFVCDVEKKVLIIGNTAHINAKVWNHVPPWLGWIALKNSRQRIFVWSRDSIIA